jgi:hypothetical protein
VRIPRAEPHRRGKRLPWKWPELLALAVLLAVAALALGGLVSGILNSTGNVGPPNISLTVSSAAVGTVIELSAGWVSTLIAVLLFGILGLSWWQLEASSNVAVVADREEDGSQARGRIDRARRIVTWTFLAMAVTALGSVAGLVGSIMSHSGNDAFVFSWSQDVSAGASTLAVLVSGALAWWRALTSLFDAVGRRTGSTDNRRLATCLNRTESDLINIDESTTQFGSLMAA